MYSRALSQTELQAVVGGTRISDEEWLACSAAGLLHPGAGFACLVVAYYF